MIKPITVWCSKMYWWRRSDMIFVKFTMEFDSIANLLIDMYKVQWWSSMSHTLEKQTLWHFDQSRCPPAWMFMQYIQNFAHSYIGNPIPQLPYMTSKDSDQSVQICSLINVFTGSICHKAYFYMEPLISLKFSNWIENISQTSWETFCFIWLKAITVWVLTREKCTVSTEN